jgi:hypothetical protein
VDHPSRESVTYAIMFMASLADDKEAVLYLESQDIKAELRGRWTGSHDSTPGNNEKNNNRKRSVTNSFLMSTK